MADDEPIFIEDTVRNYGHRTWENAVWSDITLALAVDMSSPGEKTTRRAAGERYVGFVLPVDRLASMRSVFRRRRMLG